MRRCFRQFIHLLLIVIHLYPYKISTQRIQSSILFPTSWSPNNLVSVSKWTLSSKRGSMSVFEFSSVSYSSGEKSVGFFFREVSSNGNRYSENVAVFTYVTRNGLLYLRSAKMLYMARKERKVFSSSPVVESWRCYVHSSQRRTPPIWIRRLIRPTHQPDTFFSADWVFLAWFLF